MTETKVPGTSRSGGSLTVKAALTGAECFIGSKLAHDWNDHRRYDAMVVPDAIGYAGHRETLADPEGASRLSFRHHNLTDSPAIGQTLEGAFLVFPLAEATHNDRAIADSLSYVWTNVPGTVRPLEGCRRDVPPIHHDSTDEVFGTFDLASPARFGHDSPYGLDWRRLRDEPGREPRFTFQETLLSTVDWYRTHEVWWSTRVTPSTLAK